MEIFQRDLPNGGVECKGVWKNRDFSTNISLCLRNSTRCRHSFNRILIGTYTQPTQGCHFKWPPVILSDLTKYSTTRSVARSLCNSWASCSVILLTNKKVTQRQKHATKTRSMKPYAMGTHQPRCHRCVRPWLLTEYSSAFDAPARGSRRNIVITFGREVLEWLIYQMVKTVWEYVYSFRHNARTWQTSSSQPDRHRTTA